MADGRGVWINVNPAWTRILGWTERELVGRTSEWLEHPEDREATRGKIARLAAGVNSLTFANRLRARDGSYRTLSWSATPVHVGTLAKTCCAATPSMSSRSIIRRCLAAQNGCA